MTNFIRRLPFLALAVFALPGCDVFDESLIEEAPPADPAGTPELYVADGLSSTAPLNLSYRTDYHSPLDLAAYANDVGALPTCIGGADAPGADFFFRVNMKAGEKWHFHVDSASMQRAADFAVYVLESTIDPNQSCGKLSGIDACPAKFAEHFSFRAPFEQDYYIGVDEMVGVSESVKIFAVNAVCGNGYKEHSEYCDPSADAMPPEDCEDCRKVIQEGQDDGATSLNDGPLDAAVLATPRSNNYDFNFSGQINSGCDFDFFKFNLPDSAEVTVSLGEDTCANIDVAFWSESDASTPFVLDPAYTPCTPITRFFTSGDHFVRLFGLPALAGAMPTYTVTLDAKPR
jgi:hypothetical protein